MRIMLAVLVVLVVSGVADAAEPFDLRVMTFNVRYGTATDGENAWDLRKDILVETIRNANADIVGTQECLDFQAKYIAEQIPGLEWFGVGREADGTGEHMAVLYNAEKLQPADQGHFWLSESPEVPGSKSWKTACTRMVTWVKFNHIASGQTLWFYNTHLDHQSELARGEGAKLIAARLTALNPGEPLVLTGDFNCTGGAADAWRSLTDAGMQDAWVTCGTRKGPESTWCGFVGTHEGSDRRIDWILVRGPVTVTDIETITHNREGRYPSDHFPVLATLHVGGSEVQPAAQHH